MVLHEPEALLVVEGGPVPVGLEQAVGRGRLHVESDFGAPHREDGITDGVPAHHEVERNVVGLAVREAEEAAVVLVEVEVLVAQARVDHEPVVRLVPTLADGSRHPRDHERLTQWIVLTFDALRLPVGLDGAPCRHCQGIGLLAAEPRLGEADVVALEKQAVGLGPDAHALAIPHRNRPPGALLEGLAHRKVVEGHTERADDAATAPATLEFDLVGRLLLDDILDVDGPVLRILDRVDAEGLRVEVVQLIEFPLGPDDVGPAEEVARHRPDFPANHVITGLRVAPDVDPSDAELLALHQADLQVDAVVFGAHLHRDGLEGQVTIIAVQGAQVDALRVHEEALLEFGHIIEVAPLQAEQAVQLAGRVLGVAGERDLAEMELAALLHGHGDAQVPFRRAEQAVLRHAGVAVPLFPVVGDNGLEVGIEFLLEVFGCLEDPPPSTLLDVAHLPLERLLGNGLGTRNPDGAHLDLFPFVDVDVHSGRILEQGVPRVGHRHFRIEISLLDVMVLEDAAGRDLEVLVDNLAPDEVELAAQRFLLSPLHTGESVLGEAGHLDHADDEVDVIAPALGELHGDVAEEALVPEVADGVADPVAGNRDLVADLQAAEQFDGLDVGELRPEDRQSGDAVIRRHGQIEAGLGGLGPCGTSRSQQHHEGHPPRLPRPMCPFSCPHSAHVSVVLRSVRSAAPDHGTRGPPPGNGPL